MIKPWIFALLSAVGVIGGEPFQLKSAAAPATLLELYTSEGCSSCPPAEAWLTRLTTDPGLWRDFVPVAFHVDYWDDLGWRDPHSATWATERQRAYADQGRTRVIYTPGFMVDGREWRDWSGRTKPPLIPKSPLGTLTVASEDQQQWRVRLEPGPKPLPPSVQAYAVLLGFELTSAVTAGENRGRTLRHDFVALALAEVELRRTGQAFEGTVSLAVPTGLSPKRTAIAVWLSTPDDLAPLLVVGGWLPRRDPGSSGDRLDKAGAREGVRQERRCAGARGRRTAQTVG